MTIKNITDGSTLAQEVVCCRHLWSRLRGLLGRPKIHDMVACWIVPCNSIHTFGMKYPIDAYFLNKQNTVVASLPGLKPNRISPVYFKAYSVLEFASGKIRNCSPGDTLEFGEAHAAKKNS